jgi:hypothetical protein
MSQRSIKSRNDEKEGEFIILPVNVLQHIYK